MDEINKRFSQVIEDKNIKNGESRIAVFSTDSGVFFLLRENRNEEGARTYEAYVFRKDRYDQIEPFSRAHPLDAWNSILCSEDTGICQQGGAVDAETFKELLDSTHSSHSCFFLKRSHPSGFVDTFIKYLPEELTAAINHPNEDVFLRFSKCEKENFQLATTLTPKEIKRRGLEAWIPASSTEVSQEASHGSQSSPSCCGIQ